MAKSWLVDCRGIAKKVRHATLSSAVRIKDCGAKRECPNCHYLIDNSDVSYEWPGLPIGVKFDPSDVELLEHLAAKCGVPEAQPHKFIDEFIPTLETDKGICYTHPKHLPGATKEGTSIHFFHKTANAYASGQRKRRKIQTQHNEEDVRWHKTGKTKPIFDNGVQKGCKKIMVLYQSSHRGSKPVKSNWVMHQYHLGAEEDEREGEYVVSKIFYQQQKQTEKIDDYMAAEEPNPLPIQHGPKTPKTPTLNPPRAGSSLLCDDVTDDNMLSFTAENPDLEDSKVGSCFPPSCSQYQENVKPVEYLAGEPQAVDPNLNDINDPLLCKEIFSACAPLDNGMMNMTDKGYHGSYSIADLENIDLDTPPDFQLTDLQFGSQEDSVFSWLDRL